MLNTLTHLGLLKISGPDTARFLQGQLTCDVAAIATKGSLGAHCNPQGRILSLFYIFLQDQDYYLILPRSMIPLTINALKKYALFYKTALTEVSDEEIICGCLSAPNLGTNSEITAINIPNHSMRHLLVGSREALETSHIQFVTPCEWECLNVKEGIPAIFPETSGKFLPHELNLPALQAVSFDKGCYTGQEIIARMHYRGKAKSQLKLAEIKADLEIKPGMDILTHYNNAKKICGALVSFCSTEASHHYALVLLDKAHENADLFLESEKAPVRLSVIES